MLHQTRRAPLYVSHVIRVNPLETCLPLHLALDTGHSGPEALRTASQVLSHRGQIHEARNQCGQHDSTAMTPQGEEHQSLGLQPDMHSSGPAESLHRVDVKFCCSGPTSGAVELPLPSMEAPSLAKLTYANCAGCAALMADVLSS